GGNLDELDGEACLQATRVFLEPFGDPAGHALAHRKQCDPHDQARERAPLAGDFFFARAAGAAAAGRALPREPAAFLRAAGFFAAAVFLPAGFFAAARGVLRARPRGAALAAGASQSSSSA